MKSIWILDKLTLSAFAAILPLMFPATSLAQSANDYRSVGSGNWTDVLVWEVYNGIAWVPATTYPGQVADTHDVFIEGGHSITLSADVPNAIHSIIVGDGVGVMDKLLIGGASSINTLLITIANGGFVSWKVNVSLTMPSGASIVIDSGGALDDSKPCSAAKRIVIGSTIYSSCNGGAGAIYSFNDLNNGGGSLSVSPSSNGPLCEGEVLNLYANASGLESSSATFSWSATSGPAGYTFNSTLENPTVTGLAAGTYTYLVEATSGSISNSDSVEVIVREAPATPTSAGNQTMCSGAGVPTLTANVNSGETVDWYDAASGGALLLSGSTSYTPAAAGTYYAEARNTSTGCISSSRTPISIISSPCKIIINRQVMLRIKK